MLVTVQIDLAIDKHALEIASNDSRIFGLMQIYDALGDEKYLYDIGKKIWALVHYSKEIWDICEGDIYDFEQSSAWLFEFKSSRDTATLFLTGFSQPSIVKVIFPKQAGLTDIINPI